MPEGRIREIRRLAEPKKIRVITVDVSDYALTLGELAERKKGNTASGTEESAGRDVPQSGTLPAESLMLFCDVSGKHFDRLLFELRSQKIQVDYKAVLTKYNRNWTVARLYAELERERRSL